MLKVAELVYDLIPHVFFQRIFNLLIQFNIIGLWYYFVVAISILGTLGLIYLIQRRVRAASILQASQLAKLRSLK